MSSVAWPAIYPRAKATPQEERLFTFRHGLTCEIGFLVCGLKLPVVDTVKRTAMMGSKKLLNAAVRKETAALMNQSQAAFFRPKKPRSTWSRVEV
eukprot:1230821-Amphidinium_carterae.1